MRKAGSVMPNSLSSTSPNTAKKRRITAAITVPRSAMARRSAWVFFCVSAA